MQVVLASPVSMGDEVIKIEPLLLEDDEEPPRPGRFMWLGVNTPEREELRIILRLGERELLVAPLGRGHQMADLLSGPTQYAIVPVSVWRLGRAVRSDGSVV